MSEVSRVILKLLMWVLIIGFGSNFIMQTISYAFYKNAKQMEDVIYTPEYIKMTDNLSGYGYHLEAKSDKIILFFGGSNYIAYNSVGRFAGQYDCPFISADYYGTQDSKGKMKLETMQKTATDLYDWAKKEYPDAKIVVMGHSYGTGMAAYLASVRECSTLFLLSAYRDLSDLYNKMIPIFWRPLDVFISNNIKTSEYAKNVTCPVYVIGSEADKTLGASLQQKVANCFEHAEVKIFEEPGHEDYLVREEVVSYINRMMEQLFFEK